jgi:hypothetical protein
MRMRSEATRQSQQQTDLERVGSPGAQIGPPNLVASGPRSRSLTVPRGTRRGGTYAIQQPSIPTIAFGEGLEDRLQGFLGVHGGLSSTGVHPDAGNMANMLPMLMSQGVTPSFGSGPFVSNAQTNFSIGGPATVAALARLGQAPPSQP